MVIVVDTERCTGCGACVDVCPAGAMRLEGGVATVDRDLCRECEACVEACPQGAVLSVSEPETERMRLPEPVTVRVPQTGPTGRSGVATLAAKTLPWLGAAAAFVGHEILPRMASALLESWERGGDEARPEPRRTDQARPTSHDVVGGQHRHRQRRGRA